MNFLAWKKNLIPVHDTKQAFVKTAAVDIMQRTNVLVNKAYESFENKQRTQSHVIRDDIQRASC